MKQSLSWIDPADLRTGLQDLVPSTPGNPLAQLASRPDFGSSAPDRGRIVRPGAPVAAHPLPFEPPPGAIQSKFDTFLRWAGDRLGSEKLFLAGHEGLCLAQSSLAPELVVSSTWAVSAWEKAREVLGCEGGGTVVFEGPDERFLVLVVEEGSWGMRGLGAIVGSQPEASILAEIGRSLRALIHSVEAHEAPGPAFK